ncbi:MAG: ATP-binding protein [Clostridia bacterium]|nr:ATP-binding protein [Clostridia bacterium]
MKLLYLKATGFKNLQDDCVIDFTAKSKKTTEDKEYELQEIDDGLFVYNTVAFIGKNASGKTSFLDLLDCAYSILGDFSLEDKNYSYKGIHLTMFFYHEGSIYKYVTDIDVSQTLNNKATFVNQKLYVKPYYKSYIKTLFLDDGFRPVENIGILPEDTSILFFVLKKKETKAVFFNSDGEGVNTYRLMFNALKRYKLSTSVLSKILHLFDENVDGLSMLDDHNYELITSGKKQIISDNELLHYLSSGTTKGLLLYVTVIASLKYGFDLIIDEIENHFHKTLVENIINLYKDKSVNQHNATLYFSTHYCELLDLFNRQDNIWVCRADKTISALNMYENFNIRTELSKSRQFYNDAFKTAVNYDDLMNIKKEFLK